MGGLDHGIPFACLPLFWATRYGLALEPSHHRRRHQGSARSPRESLPSSAIFTQGLSGRPPNRTFSLAIEPCR